MTRKQQDTYRLLLLCLIPFVVAISVLRTLLLLKDYDAALGTYGGTTLLDDLTHLLLLVGGILIAAFFLLQRKKFSFPFEKDILVYIFPASLSAITLLSLGIVNLVFTMQNESGFGVRLLSIFLLLFAAAGCVYFVLCAQGAGSDGVRALLLMSVVIALILSVISVYFDKSVLLDSPSRILSQLSLILFFFFFLSETRFYIERQMPVIYISLGLLSILFTSASAIPNLIFVAVRHGSVLSTPVVDFTLFAFGVYAVIRLVRVAFTGCLRVETVVDNEEVSDFIVDDELSEESDETKEQE